MANRVCVFVNDEFVPVNRNQYYVLTFPERIGDNAIIREKDIRASDKMTILLKSKGMSKDSTYLVDVKNKEAYPYNLEGDA